MHLPVSKVPKQPGINGTKAQFAPFSLFPCAGYMVQYPSYFSTAKVGINYQPGFVANKIFHLPCFQFIAKGSRPSVLPHNGIVHRLTRVAFPYHRGFPLIGNANGSNIFCMQACKANGFYSHAQLGTPNLHRIMFYPARLWKYLCKFFLCGGNNFTRNIKNNSPATGSTLVESKNVFWHVKQFNFEDRGNLLAYKKEIFYWGLPAV